MSSNSSAPVAGDNAPPFDNNKLFFTSLVVQQVEFGIELNRLKQSGHKKTGSFTIPAPDHVKSASRHSAFSVKYAKEHPRTQCALPSLNITTSTGQVHVGEENIGAVIRAIHGEPDGSICWNEYERYRTKVLEMHASGEPITLQTHKAMQFAQRSESVNPHLLAIPWNLHGQTFITSTKDHAQGKGSQPAVASGEKGTDIANFSTSPITFLPGIPPCTIPPQFRVSSAADFPVRYLNPCHDRLPMPKEYGGPTHKEFGKADCRHAHYDRAVSWTPTTAEAWRCPDCFHFFRGNVKYEARFPYTPSQLAELVDAALPSLDAVGALMDIGSLCPWITPKYIQGAQLFGHVFNAPDPNSPIFLATVARFSAMRLTTMPLPQHLAAYGTHMTGYLRQDAVLALLQMQGSTLSRDLVLDMFDYYEVDEVERVESWDRVLYGFYDFFKYLAKAQNVVPYTKMPKKPTVADIEYHAHHVFGTAPAQPAPSTANLAHLVPTSASTLSPPITLPSELLASIATTVTPTQTLSPPSTLPIQALALHIMPPTLTSPNHTTHASADTSAPVVTENSVVSSAPPADPEEPDVCDLYLHDIDGDSDQASDECQSETDDGDVISESEEEVKGGARDEAKIWEDEMHSVLGEVAKGGRARGVSLGSLAGYAAEDDDSVFVPLVSKRQREVDSDDEGDHDGAEGHGGARRAKKGRKG